MKTYLDIRLTCSLLSILLSSAVAYPQSLPDGDDLVCGIGAEGKTVGTYATTASALTGGREKTSVGTLRVLVIFVRFADDMTNTTYWPNYSVLPGWAQTIVDANIPANNIFPNLNLSNFFDRASGGDGLGNLGSFHVIGDVYYITTDNPRSSYGSDAAVNQHVWQKLDNQGLNYKLYDNWRFMNSGQYYNHEYLPGVGDGELDHVFMMWRQQSFFGSNIGGYVPLAGSYVTNDGVTINGNSGSMQFRYLDLMGPFSDRPKTLFFPAHEYTHYLFGGNNVTGHLDGRSVYGTTPNVGNVMFFGLMTANASGNFCAYERYRAGWLTPDVVVTNMSSVPLLDTHVKNKAIVIPIRYDASSNVVEYFLIENYHTQNDYSDANPFLSKQIFDHTLRKGLLVYHIENEDLTLPANSNLDIACADGIWQWAVIQGASTPPDRTDDVIGHSAPTYHTGYDERDQMTLTVGSTVWTDYFALWWGHNGCGTGNPCNLPCDAISCNHGWRYTKSSWLGDNEDFFRENETDVYSPFSNPDTYLASGTNSNRAFEITSYDEVTKQYVLKVAVDATNVLALKPSKPQFVQASYTSPTQAVVSWSANLEPDVTSGGGYDLYRAVYYNGGTLSYTKINSSLLTTTTFNDTPPIPSGLPSGVDVYHRYHVVAKDNTGKYSVPSEDFWLFAGRTVSGSISANTTWNGRYIVVGTVTVNTGITLTIDPGTTVKFASGVSMTIQSGARISAIGTTAEPIRFTSSLPNPVRRSYGTIFIYSSNNQFEYCTVEYSDWGLKFVGPASGNIVRNCTFRQNDQAIRIHYNDAEVRDCLIEDNRHAFVLIDNTSQYGNIYIDGNTVRNNDRDGIYSVTSVVDIFRTVLDNNGLSNGLGTEYTFHGIYADYSSDIALGSRSWDEDLSFTGGYNTVKNNHGAGVYVNNSSLVLLGDIMTLPTVTVYRAGNNSIHNNGTYSGTYNGKEVYNLTATTVEANKNYWGGTPTSSQFDLPVDYGSWLTSPPSGTSIVGLPPGNGSSANPSLLAKNRQSQTSGDDDDTRIKKEMIQNLRALIAQSPESPEAVAALMTIFSFIRTDWNDKLGERNGIYGYLNGLYEAHGQLEIGKRALHLMSLERLSQNDFAEAIELSQTAMAKFSGPLRQESMSQLIRLLLRTGQMAQAQQFFEAYKTDYPDDLIMHELLQGMFKDAEHDFAHGAPLNGDFPRPATNQDITESSTPHEFSLAQNFPNPFNPTTEFRYALPQAGKVTLRIFNVLGEQVRVLVDEYKPAGRYTEVWDGKNSHGKTVASGTYLYQISYLSSEPSAQTIIRRGKMSLLR